MTIDNLSVAAMATINEIAAAYRLQPHQFVATAKHDDKGQWIIEFEAPPDAAASHAFARLLESVGLDAENRMLVGSEENIWRCLQKALTRAPGRRGGRG